MAVVETEADALPAEAPPVEAPAPPVEAPAPDFDFDFDLGVDLDDVAYLLQDFFHDVPSPLPSPPRCAPSDAEAADSPAAEGSVGSSDGSVASGPFMCDLEKFLMEEPDAEVPEEAVVDDDVGFFAELFGEGEGSGVDCQVAAPETVVESATASEEDDKKVAPKRYADGEEDDDEDSGDDPISKKRRRQMRNRDSAMKSRERKKAYVKDLEMKSKYLEAECRRLCYALQCYAAENMALHQRLQNGKVICASAAKQESAVLFVESLLLGSLFWLVSIIGLFLIPSLPNQKVGGLERDVVQGMMAKGVANEQEGHSEIPLVILRKRCRGMRTRIKANFLHDNSCPQSCLIRC